MTVALNYAPPASHWIDDLLVRICVWLQPTPTQYALAEQHYHAVGDWLSVPGSAVSNWHPEIFPQGSLRIGTTVRPIGREEYDLDLVCLLAMHGGQDPLAVLNLVERRLREHGTYAPMVERKNRCIRLNFAKQFHMDILPARADLQLGGTCLLVPDRSARLWKPSNPKGYATWFDERGYLNVEFARSSASVEPLPAPEGAEEKTPLQLSVQLFKRARDIRFCSSPALAPISIVLTTLAGQHYGGESHPLEALTRIVDRISASIPTGGRLRVCNPANAKEDLSERWDKDTVGYVAFVGLVRDLSQELRELQRADGLDQAKRRLDRLFGTEAPDRAIRGQASAVEKARELKGLRVFRGSAGLTASIASETVLVKRNTFYGD